MNYFIDGWSVLDDYRFDMALCAIFLSQADRRLRDLNFLNLLYQIFFITIDIDQSLIYNMLHT